MSSVADAPTRILLLGVANTTCIPGAMVTVVFAERVTLVSIDMTPAALDQVALVEIVRLVMAIRAAVAQTSLTVCRARISPSTPITSTVASL